jgi:prolyl-tRNA editing enzyme YbaK/EbsC (Cys-tRNA(Pro) deacylase)
MNPDIISAQFSEHQLDYKRITHPPCRTSQESLEARQTYGGEKVTGAKALVIQLKPKGANSNRQWAVFVLPGTTKKLDSKAIKSHFGIKSMRFATPEELSKLTEGLVPGSMPPFGPTVFPNLDALYVDTSLTQYLRIGFNAASLTESLIVNGQDYLRVAKPNAIFSFSQPLSLQQT